ncbi:MAG: hypothetical protein ACI3ZP_08450 [Candidatus Cryptobacteroides sp.]
MRKTILILFLAVAAFPAAAQEFETLFDNFAREAQEEHARFRDEANKRFADFLKESWQEFQVFAGKEYPRKPKPKTAPVAPVETPDPQNVLPDAEAPVKPEARIPEMIPETSPVNENPEGAIEPGTAGTLTYACDFYGNPIKILVPDAIANYMMAGHTEKDIAMFWNALASVDYEKVIIQIQGYAEEMGLEGWSLCLLVENIVKTVFGLGREDEMEVFKTFLLNQMGLDAKMGLVDGKIKTMVCVKEQVYARLFCELEGKHYYFGPEVQNVTQLMSYSGNFSDDLIPVSALISKPMRLGGKNTEATVQKNSKVFEKSISLPVNLAQCAFYLDYPQVDVDIYARASYDETFVTALTNALEPALKGMDDIAKANMLLAFLQFDFNYSTDEDQFGFEKPFFLEENFIYQANDCEDRSILFSFLVRKLLGLDVVLLDYPDHIATAVCFNKEVPGDSFIYNGRRFTICDPTYIGAPVGMAMEDYRNIKFNVLTL